LETLDIILKEMNLSNIPVKKSWRLNERFYGALQGKNKDEIKNNTEMNNIFFGEEAMKRDLQPSVKKARCILEKMKNTKI